MHKGTTDEKTVCFNIEDKCSEKPVSSKHLDMRQIPANTPFKLLC